MNFSKRRLKPGLYKRSIAQNPDKTNGDMIYIIYPACTKVHLPIMLLYRQYIEKVYFRSNKAMGMQVEDHAIMII